VEVINYKITVDTKSAQKNTTDLTGTIQEQKDITLEFERELRRLEEQLGRTSKSNLSAQKQIKDQMLQVKSALKDQKLSLRELNNEKSKQVKLTDINTESLSKNYGVVQLLDQVTGGLASQVRSVVDANRLFNISLKGTKTALLATGIGAFVVALGFVLSYYEEIKDFITGSNIGLEKQIALTEKLIKEQQEELSILDASEESLKRQGKTEQQISDLKKDQLRTIITTAKENLIEEKRRLSELQNLKTEGGSTLEQFGRTYGKIFTKIYGFIDDLFAKVGIDLGLADSIQGAQNWLFEGIFGTEEDITGAQAQIAETERLILEAQNRLDGILNKEDAAKPETFEKRQAETVNGLTPEDLIVFNSAELLNERLSELGLERLTKEEITQEGINAIRQANLDNAASAFGLLSQLAGENKKLQAAAIIGANAAGIAQNIIDTNAANARLTLEAGLAAPALITANFVRMGIGIASSIAATAQGLSALGASGVGGGTSGGAGGRSAPAPSFNLVQGSATNQIANSLQRSNEPLKAYVVSKDMTNKQELDRTIQQGSVL
jgi:hypothetical protein